MKLIATTALFFFCIGTSKAQEKPVFSSQNYAGILEGSSGTSLQIQSVNGIRFRNWFAGAGAGIDYYFKRSIPLYFSAGRILKAFNMPFYLNADIGYNFPWEKKDIYYIQSPGVFSGGMYWAGGVGYKSGKEKSAHSFLLHVGYSFKRLEHKTESNVPCLVPPCPKYTQLYDYRLNRLSVKLGWMF